jgi:DNA-binding transcriptional LysR family regulator
MKQMVSGGVGVAVLSALAVEQEVQNGTLLAFEMDKSALKRTIYLITLKSQQLSRMEQKLVDFLKSPHRRKRAEAQN